MPRSISPTHRRLRKGMSLEEIDSLQSHATGLSAEDNSPFQLQEYLASLVLTNPHDIQTIVTLPRIDKGKGKQTEESSDTDENEGSAFQSTEDGKVDRGVWMYESLRRLCRDLSSPWMTSLERVCSRQTCNEMKGGEWLYLCAAHASTNETECCAIDYIQHTLDAASALLNSSRYFPSRLSVSPTSYKHFTSISRRLYRVFAHMFYHHNELFQSCESETSLYARFKKTMQTYAILADDVLAVPATYESGTEEDRRNPPDGLPVQSMDLISNVNAIPPYMNGDSTSEPKSILPRPVSEPDSVPISADPSKSSEIEIEPVDDIPANKETPNAKTVDDVLAAAVQSKEP